MFVGFYFIYFLVRGSDAGQKENQGFEVEILKFGSEFRDLEVKLGFNTKR